LNDVEALLERIERGDRQAADQLLPLVYDELRKLAAWQMAGGNNGPTLQPTALVHEAWLRLGGDSQPKWQSHAHFVAAAAQAMRHILIDRARKRRAVRHGGGQERVDAAALDFVTVDGNDDLLLKINEALDRFAGEDPQKAELVKMRFFAGLTLKDAAQALDISEPTANRWWAYSRAWLAREIGD
jgi:RNA polymerase sigma factor (TIGR02999 family)